MENNKNIWRRAVSFVTARLHPHTKPHALQKFLHPATPLHILIEIADSFVLEVRALGAASPAVQRARYNAKQRNIPFLHLSETSEIIMVELAANSCRRILICAQESAATRLLPPVVEAGLFMDMRDALKPLKDLILHPTNPIFYANQLIAEQDWTKNINIGLSPMLRNLEKAEQECETAYSTTFQYLPPLAPTAFLSSSRPPSSHL